VAGIAPAIDAEFRALADAYQLTDLSSARAGEPARPKPPPQRPAQPGPVTTFGPGFAAAVDPRVGAQCLPSVAPYAAKQTVPIGGALAGSPGRSIAHNTRIEARHTGRE
jgi:hypothetical protein